MKRKGLPLVKCSQCGKTWDTVNPCALCNATRKMVGMLP